MSHPIEQTAAYTNVKTNLDRLGIALPSDMTKAVEETAAARERFTEYTADRAGLVEATHRVLADGGNPITDGEVRDLAIAHVLGSAEVARGLADREANQRILLLRQHAADIIASLKPVVTEAQASITAARADLPADVDPVDTPAGHVHAHDLPAWSRGRMAVDTLRQVAGAWTALYRATTGTTPARHHLPLAFAAMTPEQVKELPAPTRLDLITTGMDLADHAEYRQRVADYTKAQQQAADEAQAEAVRRYTNDRRMSDTATFGQYVGTSDD